ncbi:molybdenum cofactor guanylyltransferase [Tissierella pigra]|uniref:Probable molybdenum cofactor guanylyltransferase n=1 Tax=Tissierella pigra TaxID=2607614 RepID=A0A6N7XZ65_9FIRM|nr:molybdenum cofactor guanylyltransferase [Tissierella pigra]MSU02743.1 molybdenum cofactor guanylyltransferase [Tissierella pigra]
MKSFGTAIILAGGKSSRMGFDKQFIEVNQDRLMDIVINKLKKEFKEIIIVTNKPEGYYKNQYIVTKDIIEGKGPLSGIHAGLKLSSSRYAFVVACDMPHINLDYIRYMKEFIGNENIDGSVTKYGELVEPFNGFYSKGIIENIEKHLLNQRRSINSLLKELNIKYVEESKAREFSPNWDMFINLNTQEDLIGYLKKID